MDITRQEAGCSPQRPHQAPQQMSEIDMSTTNTHSTPEADALLADAARADLALDKRADAFHLASRELAAVQQKIRHYKGVSAWITACDEHGGPDGALVAKHAEVEQAREHLAQLEAARLDMQRLRERLDDALRVQTDRLSNEAFKLFLREEALTAELKGIEAAREKNIESMIGLKVDEATARSLASPSLDEIAALRAELAGIPALKAENARLMASYTERAKLACAEA